THINSMTRKKDFIKKYLIPAGVALTLGVLFFIGAHTAHAQSAQPELPDLFSCFTSPASCAIYLISLLINSVLGFLIMLAAMLTQAILGLNNHVFDSPAVQSGFSVALAFANLGFVLAIIVIAIATILRNHTYGIKELFWKLVVMAILVNFGLVI